MGRRSNIGSSGDLVIHGLRPTATPGRRGRRDRSGDLELVRQKQINRAFWLIL